MLSFHAVPGADLTRSALPDAPVVPAPEPTPGFVARAAAYALTRAARVQLAAARHLDPQRPVTAVNSKTGMRPATAASACSGASFDTGR